MLDGEGLEPGQVGDDHVAEAVAECAEGIAEERAGEHVRGQGEGAAAKQEQAAIRAWPAGFLSASKWETCYLRLKSDDGGWPVAASACLYRPPTYLVSTMRTSR